MTTILTAGGAATGITSCYGRACSPAGVIAAIIARRATGRHSQHRRRPT